MSQHVTSAGYYSTADEARQNFVQGWNLRCNRCGTYGADWLPNERPGWGSLALCPEHSIELLAEHRRHIQALEHLRQVNYEQDLPKPSRRRAEDW